MGGWVLHYVVLPSALALGPLLLCKQIAIQRTMRGGRWCGSAPWNPRGQGVLRNLLMAAAIAGRVAPHS
eukprot:13987833-Alexandrium_andersonii.AAC.1